jgi:hypothetical protein
LAKTLEQLIAKEKPAVVVKAKEGPGPDIKLSSLKRYVEATGSKLRIVVELPDGSHYGFKF